MEIGPRGRWKRASFFQTLQKKVCFQKLTIKGKRRQFVKSFTKTKFRKLVKIEEMADIFLNSANFASHALLMLAPPNGYALSLKELIKVSKVSWTSQLLYEKNVKKDKLHFSEKNTSQKPRSFRVKGLTAFILCRVTVPVLKQPELQINTVRQRKVYGSPEPRPGIH